MTDLYQEIILDHMRHPRHKGKLPEGEGVLRVYKKHMGCADALEVALVVDSTQRIIQDIRWQGEGCAISIAAMSLLSEFIIGKKISEVLLLTKADLLDWLGLERISLARENCLLLSLKAVQEVLQQQK